jgi:2-polyprenyl-3-methyl-5-hydroxy-6-metoxy-1,4-benzoquinol methylase
MQFWNLTLERCKYGWMLFSGPYIGKCFELYGQYSESEISLMRAFLREGATVVDVGANIGDLTVPLAKLGQQYPDLCSSIFLMCEKGRT